jgi:glycosyltransferase involved in cell wall biosynthesis
VHILWVSDSPTTPSGFGNVTRFVCEGLARRGHKVSILGWQSHQPFAWNGCQVYATGVDPLGGDALYAYLVRHRPDVVIALADVWWLPYFTAPHVQRQLDLTRTPWVLYFPIDGNTEDGGLPPSWIEMLRAVDVPVAMSHYGQRVAQSCGIPCDYIPHGVDLQVFAPAQDREQAKQRVGLGGKFVVLSDSRNQPRKMLPRLLDAFARFARQRPDAVLHLHTDPEDEFTHSSVYSYNVRADVRHLEIESQVQFTEGFKLREGGGIPLAALAGLYRAADVHLLASSGEGFGLPTLQAAASGAVPMACDYSASRELVTGHGEAIRVADWSRNEFGIRRALIDAEDAAAKLLQFYEDRQLLAERSRASREFAMNYGWDEVVDEWNDLLGSIRRAGRQRAEASVFDLGTETFSHSISKIPGVSITVKAVRREAGRVEASVLADARRNPSDVRIPVIPASHEAGGVRVPRQWSYVGVAEADIALFAALKAIFPVTHGWVPCFGAARRHQAVAGLKYLPLESPAQARFELAQSVLLLNVSGSLPDSLLLDAALYGVCCLGAPGNRVQAELWPELTTDDACDALSKARQIFTDAACARRLSLNARANCLRVYHPDEADAAAWLRRLHAANKAAGIGAGR